MEFNAAIHSIPLVNHQVETNTKCQVSGWGAMEWQGFMPDELQVGNVTIRDRARCNFTYADIITSGMICANGINYNWDIVDVCQGGNKKICIKKVILPLFKNFQSFFIHLDSGGPLVCDNQLVGLASFGLQCGASLDHPGVFVDIFYYREWILQNWSGASTRKTYNMFWLFMFTFSTNLIWMFVMYKKE